MEIFTQLIEKIVHILVPIFSQYEGRGDQEAVEKTFWVAFRVNLILSLLIGATVIIFAHPFITWWIGPEYVLAGNLTVWLGVGFIFFTMHQTGKTALFGISKHKRFAILSMFESISAATVGFLLGVAAGPAYIAIGMAKIMIFFSLVAKPTIISVDMNLSILRYYSTICEVFIKVGLFLVFFASLLYSYKIPESIIEIIVAATVMWGASIPVIWWSLNDDAKRIVRTKILSRFKLVANNA